MKCLLQILACAAVCLGVSMARAEDVAKTDGLPNPFFALSNGVADAKHRTHESQAAMLAELGYDGIGPSGVRGIPEMLAALDKHEQKMFALYVGAQLDADKPAYDPGLPAAIEALKGRDTLVWLTVRSSKFGCSDPAGDDRAAEVVGEIATMAEKAGLRVALYPHVGVWVERVEDAVRVAKKVNRPNVGATFNLCHWLKVGDEANMEKRLDQAMPHLFVVTINGADHEGNWDRLIQPLDRGEFDVYGLLLALRKRGYAGPVGLQCYAVKGDKYENLKRSMAAWKKMQARMAVETKE